MECLNSDQWNAGLYDNPFATDTPILSPVYEPGPLLTATASRSLIFKSLLIEYLKDEYC